MGRKMGCVVVRLNGGAQDKKYVKYSTPLPERIVMAHIVKENGQLGLQYEDYQRLSKTTDYYWVDPNTGKAKVTDHETTS